MRLFIVRCIGLEQVLTRRKRRNIEAAILQRTFEYQHALCVEYSHFCRAADCCSAQIDTIGSNRWIEHTFAAFSGADSGNRRNGKRQCFGCRCQNIRSRNTGRDSHRTRFVDGKRAATDRSNARIGAAERYCCAGACGGRQSVCLANLQRAGQCREAHRLFVQDSDGGSFQGVFTFKLWKRSVGHGTEHAIGAGAEEGGFAFGNGVVCSRNQGIAFGANPGVNRGVATHRVFAIQIKYRAYGYVFGYGEGTLILVTVALIGCLSWG